MTEPLWAVTCLFNPAGYQRRAQNFRTFREHLKVPLVAVELSFDGAFELEAKDADILIRLSEGDVMWQKERLLNIGVAQLPAHCEAVAVLDGDILFDRADWARASLLTLETACVVQPFATAFYLERDAPRRDAGFAEHDGTLPSVVNIVNQGYSPAWACQASQYRAPGPVATPGLAWVYRRDLLARHGLYEGSIIGGGDAAMTAASWGAFESLEQRHALNDAQRRYYRAWAEPWHRDVKSQVGFLQGDLFHLWHGDFGARQPGLRSRHPGLSRLGFDPARDLLASPGQAWRWTGDRPDLHQFVANYLNNRRDDG